MHVPPKNSYMDSSSKNDTYFIFKSGVSPFVELCPFHRVIMIFCNQNISKTITAMSFKLGQLIDGNELITLMNFFNKSLFFSYCPLQILALKSCNQDISKTISASSFKL